MLVSQLELPSSPVEQASWATQTWYWDPIGIVKGPTVLQSQFSDFLPNENLVSYTAQVFKYNERYPNDVLDVTAIVLDPALPEAGTGIFFNCIKIIVLPLLTPGFDYRVQMTCLGDLDSTPARFFVIRCRS